MLRAESRIVKNKNSRTLYLTIPAKLAVDSSFDLKEGTPVTLEYVPKQKALIVKKK